MPDLAQTEGRRGSDPIRQGDTASDATQIIFRYSLISEDNEVESEYPANDDIPVLRLTRHTGSPRKGDVMPILDRTHDPARPITAPAPRIPLPHHEMSIPARLRRLLTPSRRAWPTTIALLALIVFIMFLTETTLLTALIAALATLAAGGILLILLFDTGWITQRRRTPDPPRR